MALPPEHTALLQRKGYPIPTGDFTDDERQCLSRFGHWMEALANGTLTATTPEQERFVQVARGEAEPRSAFELVWVKARHAVLLPRQPQVDPFSVAGCLERLLAARTTAAEIQEEYDDRRAAILAQVQPLLDALEAEFAERLRLAGEAVAELQTEARQAVLAHGENVRHRGVLAVYARGRTTWDTKGLDGYAQRHPEVEQFRRVGEPTVSLRFDKGEKGA